MNFETLQKMVQGDMILTATNLENEILRIPLLHEKYAAFLYQIKKQITDRTNELNRLKVEKKDYYSGSAHPDNYIYRPLQRRYLKAEIPELVESDLDIISLKSTIADLQNKLDYLEQIMYSIRQRNFQIKNSIDYLKFKHGVS